MFVCVACVKKGGCDKLVKMGGKVVDEHQFPGDGVPTNSQHLRKRVVECLVTKRGGIWGSPVAGGGEGITRVR